MEADWEIEIGGEAPVMDAHWTGLVDLRGEPEQARRLSETYQLPQLAEVLIRLNAANSPVWTSKCDVFVPDHFDPDDLDAPIGVALRARACYVDLLPRDEMQWDSVEVVESACRGICDRLRSVPARSCRADLVIRRAMIEGVVETLGVTAYITAAGPDEPSAAIALATALAAFANAAMAAAGPVRAS